MIPFECLGLSIVSLWVSRSSVVWNALLLVAAVLAFKFGVMDGFGLLFAVAAGGSTYAYFHLPGSRTPKIALAVGMSALTLGLYAHFFPGFREYSVFSNVALSPGAYPTSLIWSFDKPLAGLMFLGWSTTRIHSGREWLRVLRITLPIFGLCAGLMIAVAVPIHAIGWAPKFNRLTALFTFGNLLFVCIPEEAFFRGFVQRRLDGFFSSRPKGPIWSVAISSLLFGVCHFAGGIGLIFVATVAGVFYGIAYQRSGRLEASIIAHFLLNLTHFALFSYPALKPH